MRQFKKGIVLLIF